MLRQTISNGMLATCAFIDQHFRGRYALLKIAVVAVGIAWLIAPPLYDFLTEQYRDGAPLIIQQQHPFTPSHYPPKDHWAKTQFRLVPPLIGRVFDFRAPGYFALQFTSFLVIFLAMTHLLHRATRDVVLTALLMFALAATAIGGITNIDAHGWFDGLAIAFLLLAMLWKRPYAIFACLFLAFFTDERAMIASPMVLLYHLSDGGSRTRLTLLGVIRLNGRCWAMIAAILVYLACRLWLQSHFGLFTAFGWEDQQYIRYNLNEWAIGFWAPIEALWLVVVGSLVILALRRDYLLLAGMVASITLMAFTSMLVNDISRSMSYVAIALPLAAAIFVRDEPNSRPFFFTAMVLCVICPTYMVTGSAIDFRGAYRNVSQLLPLPLAAWHLFR